VSWIREVASLEAKRLKREVEERFMTTGKLELPEENVQEPDHA